MMYVYQTRYMPVLLESETLQFSKKWWMTIVPTGWLLKKFNFVGDVVSAIQPISCVRGEYIETVAFYYRRTFK